jgi:argininosuccinate lyase
LQDLPLESLQAIDSHFASDFYAFVKLENVLAIHDVPGGTAPIRVKEAIAFARKKISSAPEEAHAHA